jgi:hypothetical protein
MEADINLPIFQGLDQVFQLMQTKWSAILNPIIANPSNNRSILGPLNLVSGDNIISHKLGRNIQGWGVVLISGVANIYDKQSTNQKPGLFLILNSSASVTVSIEVF